MNSLVFFFAALAEVQVLNIPWQEFPATMPLIYQSRVPLACSLSFVVGVAFAVVSDVLSAPRFLVDVFFPSLFTLNFKSVFSL